MGSFKQIDDFFNNLTSEYLRKQVPTIIAVKAKEFFKERFTTKEWDGVPWQPAKKPLTRGTLMVKSSALVNSIQIESITPEKVVISAGNEMVPYAKIHNEGGVIDHPGGTSFIIKKGKAVFVSKEKAFAWAAKKGRELPKTKPHKIPMPRRQFMGHSERLNDVIMKALRDAFNAL